MEAQGRFTEIRKAGMGLAAISYDPVPVLTDFSARRGITFPLLSDAGSDTIKRCSLLNTTIAPRDELYGIPFPGTFIIDRRGVVTFRFFEAPYQERDTVSSILVRPGRHVEAYAAKVAGAHVTLTSYATDQVGAPGTHLSLVVEVAPAPRVHVYAPGASREPPSSPSRRIFSSTPPPLEG